MKRRSLHLLKFNENFSLIWNLRKYFFFRYFLRSLKSSYFGEMVRCLISSRKNILIGNLIEIIFFLLCTLFYIVNFLQWNFEYWLDNKMDIYKRMFLKFQFWNAEAHILQRISSSSSWKQYSEISFHFCHFLYRFLEKNTTKAILISSVLSPVLNFHL